MLKDERIAPFVNLRIAVQPFRQDRIGGMLLPFDERVILGNRGPLLRKAIANAGVNQHELALLRHRCAAGKDMLLALLLGWPQGDGLMLPVDEVLAAEMAPVHVAPGVAVGIELIEQVIMALVE